MSHSPIKFGTDGWRAIIADDFTFANVRRVAEAIAAYQKFVESAAGHFPDQEWQARQRLHLLGAK